MTPDPSPEVDPNDRPSTARPCSLPRRLAALLYDGLILAGLWMLGAALVVVPSGGAIETGALWFQAYLLAVAFAYFGSCWWLGGQTVGMRSWRIRLISDRDRLTPGQLAVRFVVALGSIAALGAGFWTAAMRADQTTWHDRASATRLVVGDQPRRSNA